MLILDILEESEKKFSEIKAVKWLKKKEIYEISYHEIMENVMLVRKGLSAESFQGNAADGGAGRSYQPFRFGSAFLKPEKQGAFGGDFSGMSEFEKDLAFTGGSNGIFR